MRPVTPAQPMFVWIYAGRIVGRVLQQGFLINGTVAVRYIADVEGLLPTDRVCDRFACAKRKVEEQLARRGIRATVRSA